MGAFWRRSLREELIGRDLAMEDVSIGHAVALLDIHRTEHLASDHGVGEIGGELGQRRNDAVGHLVFHLIGPRAALEAIGRILAEHRDRMFTRGRDRGISGGLHVCLDVGLARELAMCSILVRLLYPVGRGTDLARARVLQGWRCAWQAGEAGQLLQRNVDFDHRAIGLERGDAFEKVLIQVSIGAELQESSFGIGVREDRPGAYLFATLQAHPFGATIVHEQACDALVGADRHALHLR